MSIHNGMILVTPSSVNRTGTSATINASGSVSFTACSVLSLNGVFSSTYDNYIIDCRSTGTSGVVVSCRWRASGTDNSTANSYVRQVLSANGTTIAGSRVTDTSGIVNVHWNTLRTGFETFVYGPSLAQPTAARVVSMQDLSSARIEDFAWTHNQPVAYDGFTIFMASGDMTGLIKVYGLRQ